MSQTGKVRDFEACQIKKSECAVKKIMEAISDFTNLRKIVDKEKLSYLAHGVPI